jgi:hypothetical protein
LISGVERTPALVPGFSFFARARLKRFCLLMKNFKPAVFAVILWHSRCSHRTVRMAFSQRRNKNSRGVT